MIQPKPLTGQCPHCGAPAERLAYHFAGSKHPDDQESDLEEVGRHWTHIAMARESRLMLEVVVGPRAQESATKLIYGAARRLAPDCRPLWSSDGWEPYLIRQDRGMRKRFGKRMAYWQISPHYCTIMA